MIQDILSTKTKNNVKMSESTKLHMSDKCNELNNMLLESNCNSMKIGKIEELKNNKYITVK